MNSKTQLIPRLSRSSLRSCLIPPERGHIDPKIVEALYQGLGAQDKCVRVVSDASQLDGAVPGSSTLVLGAQRDLLETVIANSAYVICFDDAIERLSARVGVTSKRVSDLKDVAEARALGKRIQDELGRHDVVARREEAATSGEPFVFCAVADSQYLGFAEGLVENLLAVHSGRIEMHLLAVDDAAAFGIHHPRLTIHVYRPQEIWPAAQWDVLKHWPVSRQAFASKARILFHVRRKLPRGAVFLLDLDLYFYDSPTSLHSAFGDGNVLLFPQWSDVFAWARFHGIFNTGLVGAMKGAEPFLEWWSDLCAKLCRHDPAQGFFVDQAFVDMALWLFDGVRVYRGRDHNIAAWSKKTLGLKSSTAGGPMLADGRGVRSFHAAGTDEDGFFERKFLWDQVCVALGSDRAPDSLQPLFENVLDQQRCHWPKLERYMRFRKHIAARLRLASETIRPAEVRRAFKGWQWWELGYSIYEMYLRMKGQGRTRGALPADADQAAWLGVQRAFLEIPVSEVTVPMVSREVAR